MCLHWGMDQCSRHLQCPHNFWWKNLGTDFPGIYHLQFADNPVDHLSPLVENLLHHSRCIHCYTHRLLSLVEKLCKKQWWYKIIPRNRTVMTSIHQAKIFTFIFIYEFKPIGSFTRASWLSYSCLSWRSTRFAGIFSRQILIGISRTILTLWILFKFLLIAIFTSRTRYWLTRSFWTVVTNCTWITVTVTSTYNKSSNIRSWSSCCIEVMAYLHSQTRLWFWSQFWYHSCSWDWNLNLTPCSVKSSTWYNVAIWLAVRIKIGNKPWSIHSLLFTTKHTTYALIPGKDLCSYLQGNNNQQDICHSRRVQCGFHSNLRGRCCKRYLLTIVSPSDLQPCTRVDTEESCYWIRDNIRDIHIGSRPILCRLDTHNQL